MGKGALETKSKWELFAFASVGSCTAETATYPVDLIKVKLQLAGEHASGARRLSIPAAAKSVYQHDGWRGFFKGLSPALLRQASYGSLRIGLYPIAKDLLGAEGDSASVAQKLAAGVVSGASASLLCSPTDLIKIRMQADAGTGRSRYSSIAGAAKSIYADGGGRVRVFYRGVAPNVARAAIVAGVELAAYDQCKMMIMNKFGLSDGFSSHLLASIAAGFLATVASTPADVMKSRMMNQSHEQLVDGRRYRGLGDCLVRTVRTEGVLALWKGFWPSYMRLGPHVTIMFVTIEQLRMLWERVNDSA